MDEGENTPQADESKDNSGITGDRSGTDQVDETDGSDETDANLDDPPSPGSTNSDLNTDLQSDPETDVSTDIDVGSGGRDRSSPDVDFDGVVLDDDDDNQGLFDDLLSGEPIFENKEVLRPSYTPHELPHRNDQINRMATIRRPALRGETPSILIYGKTGTGKTASAKFVSQELESTSQKYDVPCEVEYINCEVTDTQYRVLAQLANTFIEKNQAVIADQLERCRELRSAAADAPAALADTEFATLDDLDARIDELETDAEEMEVPHDWLAHRPGLLDLLRAVDYHERVVVIMLDEIDKLVEKSGDDTLYNLSRMNSELNRSRISIMGISNDLKFTDFLDPRVKSSLGEEEIVFPPYDANQLRDILQHRADISFKQDALTDDVIPSVRRSPLRNTATPVARSIYSVLRANSPSARRLRSSPRNTSGRRRTRSNSTASSRLSAPSRPRARSCCSRSSSWRRTACTTSTLARSFIIYKRLCEIDADVLTQRRVTDLISELDMLGIVNAVVVSKGRYGRTKEMGLSVPVEETEAVLLSDDSRLGDIENAQPFVQARFDN